MIPDIRGRGSGVRGSQLGDPVPGSGVLAAVGAGIVAGGVVLVIALTVMMGTARGPLAAALRALRSSDAGAPDRQEVPGG